MHGVGGRKEVYMPIWYLFYLFVFLFSLPPPLSLLGVLAMQWEKELAKKWKLCSPEGP